MVLPSEQALLHGADASVHQRQRYGDVSRLHRKSSRLSMLPIMPCEHVELLDLSRIMALLRTSTTYDHVVCISANVQPDHDLDRTPSLPRPVRIRNVECNDTRALPPIQMSTRSGEQHAALPVALPSTGWGTAAVPRSTRPSLGTPKTSNGPRSTCLCHGRYAFL